MKKKKKIKIIQTKPSISRELKKLEKMIKLGLRQLKTGLENRINKTRESPTSWGYESRSGEWITKREQGYSRGDW